jgi:hypothetical protein
MNDGEAVTWLAENGLTRPQALGVIDTLRAESGLNPTAENPREHAYGIAQWTEGRKANLHAFAEQRHEPVESLKLQLAFLMHELETYERNAYNHLQLAKTPDEAIAAFVTYFERPESDAGVIATAEREAGLPFGASPTHAAGLVAPAPTGIQSSVQKHSYASKVQVTGKVASQHGTDLQNGVVHLQRLIGRLPPF